MRRRLILAAALVLSGMAPASADWREETRVLRIGYVASADPSGDRGRLDPFRAYLSERIGLAVELSPVATFEALMDAQIGGDVQYGIHSATSFAIADAACSCMEPVGVPAAFDGSTGYYSVLVVPADSAAQSLEDTRGMRLALAAGDSVGGHLVPLREFAQAGIDPAAHFGSVREYRGPEAAIDAVIAGDADVAVGWSSLSGDPAAGYSFGVLSQMVGDGRLSAHPLRIIWQSRRIPFGPHAVRRDLAPELKALLADALASMVTDSPEALEAVDRSGYGGGGFVSVDPADYAILAALAEAPG